MCLHFEPSYFLHTVDKSIVHNYTTTQSTLESHKIFKMYLPTLSSFVAGLTALATLAVAAPVAQPIWNNTAAVVPITRHPGYLPSAPAVVIPITRHPGYLTSAPASAIAVGLPVLAAPDEEDVVSVVLPRATQEAPVPTPPTSTPAPAPTEDETPAKGAPSKRASGPKLTLWEPGAVIFERPGPYTGNPTTSAASSSSSAAASATDKSAAGGGFLLTVTVTVVTESAAAAAGAAASGFNGGGTIYTTTAATTSSPGYPADTAAPASEGWVFSWA